MKEYILGPDPGTKGEGFAVMPLGRIHILAGASGTGKTRWLFQLIDAMAKGEDFMGYKTQWHPMVYCAFDRQVDEQEETMRAVGLDPGIVPHEWLRVPDLPRDQGQKDRRLEEIVRGLINKYPATKIFIFDALYILAAHGQMNNYVIMAEWLQRIGEMCREQGITVIGVVHSSKQRKGNEITDPRYAAQGSVATGGFTSCQVVAESPSTEDPEKRLIHIYPRNAPQATFPLVMNNKGILVPDLGDEDSKIYFLETRVFGGLKEGKLIAFAEIWEACRKSGMSKSTLNRYLDKLIDQGKIVKSGRGLYCQATPREVPPPEGDDAVPFEPGDYAGLVAPVGATNA
jgi:hypothetical protein